MAVLSSSQVEHDGRDQLLREVPIPRQKKNNPLFLCHSTLSVKDFTFNVVQGIPFLASQLGITWRLSAVDGEDDVDLNNNRFLKVIMDIAKKSDKMYLNVYESATPFTSTSSPPAKVSRSSCFTLISTMALSKSNDLCHTAKVEDITYEDQREQGTGHLYTSLIEPGNLEVGLKIKLASSWIFLVQKNKIVQVPQDKSSIVTGAMRLFFYMMEQFVSMRVRDHFSI